MLVSLQRSRVTITRKSTGSLSQVVASTISLSLTPNISSNLDVLFSASVTGDVTITGTKDGGAQVETITLSSRRAAVTAKSFDSFTQVALSAGIVSGGSTITLNLSGNGGGNANVESTIVESFPASFVRGNASTPDLRSGSFEVERLSVELIYSNVFEPKTGDKITNIDTGEVFFAIGTPLLQGVGYNQYWNVKLRRRQE